MQLLKIKWSILLPSEWVILGFLSYSFVRLALAPKLSLNSEWLSLPRGEYLITFFSIVLVFRLLGEYRAKVQTRLNNLVNLFLLVLIGFSNSTFEPYPALKAIRPLSLVATILLILGMSWKILVLKYPAELLLKRLEMAGQTIFQELRESLPLTLMICFYPLVPLIIQNVGNPDRDPTLATIDQYLFAGINPVHWMESLISTPLSEWLAFAYVAYVFLLLSVIGILYLKPDRALFRYTSFVICLALCFGYIGYTLVPAKGPVFTDTFHVDLNLYYTQRIKTALIDNLRIQRDCFPSLHTAITLLLAVLSWRHARPLFWIFLPIIISIPIACVYLRYHYVIDILAGFFLAAGILFFADKVSPNNLPCR